MEIVLVGNPNSGKTSLFNLLTGSKQHVGNWPGVTVEKKEGKLTLDKTQHSLTDMPGIYTLDPDTIEQKLTRDYIFNNKPGLIINILDASNIERNLYLTLQLRDSGVPMIIALNMMDEVAKEGRVIDTSKMSGILGVPIVGLSVKKEKGIDDLLNTISSFIKHEIEIKPYCSGCRNCTKCKKGEFRYQIIDSIVSSCITSIKNKNNISLSDKIDKIILNKYLALPLFFVIIFIVFALTFGGAVSKLSDLIGYLLNGLLSPLIFDGLTAVKAPELIIMLVCRGIIPGIGTVLVFLPQITVLFVLMSLLEDTGYMSRAAIMTDRLFSTFGLSGSSFIPLIMGFGCTVPALMSCRILPSEKNRKLTMMLTTFISCSARLPLYALFAAVFFAKYQSLVVFSVYILGIIIAVIVALILNKTVFHNSNTSFVMEIPPYRLPKIRNLVLHTWEKVKGFVLKAGTTLLIASILIWFLQSFTLGFKMTGNHNISIMAAIGKLLAPLFIPLGFGNWKAVTALLAGVAAKEMIVSSFSVISGTAGNAALLHHAVSGLFNSISAFSFMCFALLYLPCISSIVTMKKEFNSLKWTAGTLALDFSIAWIVSFIIYNTARIIF